MIALWRDVFANPTGHNEPVQSIDRKLKSNDHLFFVAVDGKRLLGTVMAGYDGHRGWLYSLAVDPGRRRGGIGTQLVRQAEKSLLSLGCPKLNLQVRSDNADDNADAVAFYEAMGYACEARISMGKRLEEKLSEK